jgi:predicted esterase YcpF (UPF0227 family)
MKRPTLDWPREKIQEELLKDIVGLQVEFADRAWIHELIPLLREIHDMAGEAQADAEQLADLKRRVNVVLGKHKLKGFDPYLWMIASLENRNDT